MLLIMYVYFFNIYKILLHVIEGHIGMYVCVFVGMIKVIYIGN